MIRAQPSSSTVNVGEVPSDTISCLRWSRDGYSLLAASWDGTVHTYSINPDPKPILVESKAVLGPLAPHHAVLSADFDQVRACFRVLALVP